MREWLTVIICLLIAGILLDGLRRMRRARREGLRISRSVRRFDEEGLPEPGHECSGPRVVSYRDHRDAENLTRSMRESFAKSKITVGAPSRTPEQTSLNLQESVPMLMDSVEELERQATEPKKDFTQAPSWAELETPPRKARPVQNSTDAGVGDSDYSDDDAYDDYDRSDYDGEHDSYADDQAEPAPVAAEAEPSLGSVEDLDDDLVESIATASSRQEPQSRSASENYASTHESDTPKPAPVGDQHSDWVAPEEVLVINLMAPAGQRFDGAELRDALLQQGLRFGSMNIFHRHKHADGSGPVHFSLANMVKPGTFDLANMNEFSTPGVSMFLSLPHDDSLSAFDCMAQTAKALASQLGGELKDENRSVMTRQTIEHCRQRVIEFERKQRLMQH